MMALYWRAGPLRGVWLSSSVAAGPPGRADADERRDDGGRRDRADGRQAGERRAYRHRSDSTAAACPSGRPPWMHGTR